MKSDSSVPRVGVGHTPGPWAVDEGRGVVGTWEDGTKVQVCSMSHTHWGHPTGKPFPDPVTLSNNERISKESNANATLIAVAPELLDELHNLDEWLASRTILDSGEIHNMRKSIQRYIAKAEGRQ